jgi:hypothetical protein
MVKIIGTFDNLSGAQSAARQLAQNGIDEKLLSIIGRDVKVNTNQSKLKKSVAYGSVMGAVVALAFPHGGVLYLAGHLARAAAMHFLGVTAKGLLVGAAAGGTADMLRKSGLDRQAVREASDAIAAGKFALTYNGDWLSTQRARYILGDQISDQDSRLMEMVSRYGFEHQSFILLYGKMNVWWSTDPEAAVVYRRIGRVAVVGAAPLTARENLETVISRFLNYCKEQNLDCLMLPIGEEAAIIARQKGMGLLKIGESGYFKLPEWKPIGDRGKKVRSGVNQATKAGITVKHYQPVLNQNPHTRNEIEELCQQWIETREVDALGWLLELDPFKFSEHKRYFLAHGVDGRIQGMLACSPIPARNGWYLEDLIRRPDAERGVSELLVVEALKHLSAEGAEIATLGTSPLAGIESEGDFKKVSRLLMVIYEHFDSFYHFKALHRFKSKFSPSFIDPEYAAIWPPHIRFRMVLAAIGAFDPAGLTGMMISKLRKLWREAHKPDINENQDRHSRQTVGE